MRNSQWGYLSTSVAIGIGWIFILQEIFFGSMSDILIESGDFDVFLKYGSNPAFIALWVGCIAALFAWIGITWSSLPRSSKEVRKKKSLWWIIATLLFFFGCFCLSWFVRSYSVPASGWIVLLAFVVIDVALLFWLPTLLASPRTYRLTVPGAVKFLGSR